MTKNMQYATIAIEKAGIFMKKNDIKKIKLLAGLVAALAILLAGYTKSRKKGEMLYKVSVCLGAKKTQKREITADFQHLFKSNGWAYTATEDYEQYAENGSETLIYYVILAEEEPLAKALNGLQEKWLLPSVCCTKEENPYRRL